ncbi:MAG TPA: YqgE/AlgH family protein [Burkholderiales bacterium]|jgi:putative transcriptional regulator|nr:YqgE/AlgH family protein [Burkholderiales bacterium]
MQTRLLMAVALAALVAWATPSHAASPLETIVLVAKRHLTDPFYRASVLIVRPMGGDQHVGVMLNRPTKVTLGQLFPEHKPSQKVGDPVYLGGPSNASVIFALVRRPASPGGKSLRLMPDLYMAFETATVDQIIENDPKRARFVAGLVTWRPGELRDEIRRGAWYVIDADPALVTRKADGMWEDLVRRAEMRAQGI